MIKNKIKSIPITKILNLFKGKIVIKSTKTLEIDINQVAFVLAISIASLFKSLIPL